MKALLSWVSEFSVSNLYFFNDFISFDSNEAVSF